MAKKRKPAPPSISERLRVLATLTQWQHQLICSLLADAVARPAAGRRRTKKAQTAGGNRRTGQQM